MSSNDIQAVLSTLQQQGGLDDEWLSNCQQTISQQSEATPWYVKLMLGISAWLAMIFIIIFMVLSKMVQSEQAAIAFGVIMIPLAVVLRRSGSNEFQKQIALAISMAGQTLLYIGIAAAFRHQTSADPIYLSGWAAVLLSPVLIAVYPDKLHRFISTVIMISAIVILIFRAKSPELFNLLTFAVSASAIFLVTREQLLLQKSWAGIIRPVQYGLLVSLMLLFLPTQSWIMRELHLVSHQYLSTAGVGLTLLYLEYFILKQSGRELFEKTTLLVLGATIAFLYATLPAPGIAASFLVVILGFAWGDKVLQGLGVAFLCWYISNYYYAMNITLLEKSISLMATGLILLVTRFLLRRWRTD